MPLYTGTSLQVKRHHHGCTTCRDMNLSNHLSGSLFLCSHWFPPHIAPRDGPLATVAGLVITGPIAFPTTIIVSCLCLVLGRKEESYCEVYFSFLDASERITRRWTWKWKACKGPTVACSQRIQSACYINFNHKATEDERRSSQHLQEAGLLAEKKYKSARRRWCQGLPLPSASHGTLKLKGLFQGHSFYSYNVKN